MVAYPTRVLTTGTKPPSYLFIIGSDAFALISSGALAQLGEHLLCKQGVIGSIPIRSTNYTTPAGLMVWPLRWVGSSAG